MDARPSICPVCGLTAEPEYVALGTNGAMATYACPQHVWTVTWREGD